MAHPPAHCTCLHDLQGRMLYNDACSMHGPGNRIIDMPWAPRSRQQQGLQTERKVVEQRGGRVHPRSGAGRIKDDGSSETEVIEVKDALKMHTLKASDLFKLFRRAAAQGKDAVYVIQFDEKHIRATIHITIGD